MITVQTLDRRYRNVPRAEQDRLLRFRSTHPVKRLTAGGTQWEYITSGRGDETLLILPGLLGIGEMSFQHILAFEDEYRVIAPSYPLALTTVEQMVAGIAAILDAERIDRPPRTPATKVSRSSSATAARRAVSGRRDGSCACDMSSASSCVSRSRASKPPRLVRDCPGRGRRAQ